MMLLTWVNLAYYQELMAGVRAAIAEGASTITGARSRRIGNAAASLRQAID